MICGVRNRAVLAATLATAALAGVPQTAGSARTVQCGGPTPIDRSAPIGRARPLGNVLWLGVYPFTSGYTTKVLVMAQRRIGKISIRGWNCANGARLRFWYRDGGPPTVGPSPAATIRKTGTLRTSFGPWDAATARGGYFMFWRPGLWKIVAYRGQRRVATATVVAAVG